MLLWLVFLKLVLERVFVLCEERRKWREEKIAGEQARVDVLVHLPGGRHVIV